MISPYFYDFWPVFLLLFSPLETADFLMLFKPSGDGYSLLSTLQVKNAEKFRRWRGTMELISRAGDDERLIIKRPDSNALGNKIRKRVWPE
jgi:hypothetical protein